MFGGKKKGEFTRVGAREKILKAKALQAGGQGAKIETQREGGKGETKPAVIVVLVYCLSCVLAFVLTQGPMKEAVHGYSVGIDGLNTMLFGTPNQNFFGMPMVDLAILCMVRGVGITIVAGILPFFTLLWIRLRDNASMNPFLTMWSVTVGLALIVFGSIEYVFPFLSDFFRLMST